MLRSLAALLLTAELVTAFVPHLPASRPLVRKEVATQRNGPMMVVKRGKGEEKGGKAGDLIPFDELDGSKCRIGIVKTRWNPEVVNSLYDGVRTALKDCGVEDSNIYDTIVPGSFELPLAARFLAMSRQCDVVIALGCLIKGETYHFEYIAEAVTKGLMDVQLQTTIPVIFGVLTCANDQQALARSTGDNNHGISWGKTAVEMALLRTDALSKDPGRSTLSLLETAPPTPPEKKQERQFGF